jgi:hypothetical protein
MFAPLVLLVLVLVIQIPVTVLLVASLWRLFRRGGKPGWHVFVPFLNTWTFVKIAGKRWWWFVLLFVPFVSLIAGLVVCIALARRFGRSAAFGLGVAVLPWIFLPILAFSRRGPSPPAGAGVGEPAAASVRRAMKAWERPRYPSLHADPHAPQPIRRLARRLLRAIRLSAGTVGVSVVLFGVFGFFVLSYSLDFLLPDHLDLFQRVLMLAMGVAAIGLLTYRFAVLPQTGRYSLDSLVLALERTHPGLNDVLISSLQLERRLARGDTSMSRTLARRVIDRGLAEARRVNALAPIARDQVNTFGGTGLACVAALAICFAIPWLHAGTWFSRNVLLRSDQYPQRTALKLYWNVRGEIWQEAPPGATIPVARGGKLALEVRADPQKVVPAHAYVRYEFDAGSRGELRTGPHGTGLGASRFRFTFAEVSSPMRLTIRGGDYLPPEDKAWWRVRVLERPEVSRVRVHCDFPAYTRLAPKDFDSARSQAELADLRLPVGTKMTLTVTATKPIVSARVVSTGDVVGNRMNETAMALPKVTEFSVPLIVIKGGELFVELWDFEDVSNQSALQLKLTALPDETPSVTARTKGVSDVITPVATVPLLLALGDDWGNRSGAISCTSSGRKKPYDLQEITQLLGEGGRPVRFGPARIEGLYQWDVTLLDTKPGDTLTFKVQVTDNEVVMRNPVLPDDSDDPDALILDGANVGESDSISLKIVSKTELLSVLGSRKIELTQEFQGLLQQQIDRRNEVNDGRPKYRAHGGLPQKLATELKDTRIGQEKLPTQLVRIAQQYEDIAEEMVNNKIDAPSELRILRETLAAPIRALAAGPVTAAAEGLTEAERTNDPAARDGILARVADRQNEAIAWMRKLIEHMERLATIEQIISLAIDAMIGEREIIKLTEDLNRELLRRVLPGDVPIE